MYEYIKGTLTETSPIKATVETAGLAYSIHIPLNNYSKFPQLGKEILLYLFLVVREDAHTLYGFLSRTQRDLFKKLIDISGIGPKTALALIGHLDAADLQLAVSQSNISLICKVPGIGKKTAERLVVDLRDQFAKEPLMEESKQESSDALNALVNLGYNPFQAQKAIKKAQEEASEELPLPKLITAALRCL